MDLEWLGLRFGTVRSLVCNILVVVLQTATSLVGILGQLVFITFDPSRSSWVASDLQQNQGESRCHLLATNTWWWCLQYRIHTFVPWWDKCFSVSGDCGGLMYTICYPCAVYILTSEYMYSGRFRFCGVWSLYKFWGPFWEKEYRIMNIKFGTKVYIYTFYGLSQVLGKDPCEGPWSLSPISFMVKTSQFVRNCQLHRVCHPVFFKHYCSISKNKSVVNMFCSSNCLRVIKSCPVMSAHNFCNI